MSSYGDSNKQQQRVELLQDAIGEIRDDFILEAHADEAMIGAASGAAGGAADVANATSQTFVVKKGNARKRRWAPAAVAAAVVLALGVGIFAVARPFDTSKAEMTEPEISYMTDTTSERGLVSEGASGPATKGGTGAPSSSDSVALPNPQEPRDPGEAYVLTAAEWNDNANWPFFTNLVSAGTVEFPSFGLDPRNRVRVTVTDATETPLRGYEVDLKAENGETLWRAQTDKNGVAVLFFRDGQVPQAVECEDQTAQLVVAGTSGEGGQGGMSTARVDDVAITMPYVVSTAKPDLQVMFIVDTTGSMADEIAYLQQDFSSIAGEVGSDGITYSVNFYRDEGDNYVTKCNGFTSDVSQVQSLINAEYADGGGDTPEAVAQILSETITNNGAWRDDCAKIAFLIFDAPPHEGTDSQLQAAVDSAAERGIRLIPVVASNAERDTELFGRALAIMTNGTYVFLTDDSGVGDSHLEPIVGDYTVELLHDVIVRLINDAR